MCAGISLLLTQEVQHIDPRAANGVCMLFYRLIKVKCVLKQSLDQVSQRD